MLWLMFIYKFILHTVLPLLPWFSSTDSATSSTRSVTYLRNLLAQKRKLRTRAHIHKSAARKYLRNTIMDMDTIDMDNIVNLSNIILTPDQKKILYKGLKFVDRPHPVHPNMVYQAFFDFKRKMLIHYHFRNKSNTTYTTPIFKNKSTWQPPNHNYEPLQRFFTATLQGINKIYSHIQRDKDNLSTQEREALMQLSQITNITIKRADKGGKIVLWPNDMYLTEAYKQLNDERYYKVHQINRLSDLAIQITTYLTNLYTKGDIDDTLYNYLNPTPPLRTPIFYLLPKIHKPNIPGRPIISGCGSPTEKISKYLDHYLRPIVEKSNSYIKDTTHFLQKIFSIQDTIPPKAWLVTLDVKSLYTNIPQDEGIEICLNNLQSFYGDNLPLTINNFRQLMDFTLKGNFFTFNNKYYEQIHGTAMGSPFAPNYANIFMTKIEQHILQHAPNQAYPLVWLRFIDDIFIIWPHNLTLLTEFSEYINTIHNTIKFEITYSQTAAHFLDTTIHLDPAGHLTSSLYQKPTDICNLLHRDSHHPNSCKTSVIYSQALRYRRVTTNNHELHGILNNLRDKLLKRGYHLGEINKQFQKIDGLTQMDLIYGLNHHDNSNSNHHSQNNNNNNNDDDYNHNANTRTLPFIIPYDSNTIQIGKVLNDNWHFIQNDPILNNIWCKPPVIALKRHKNFGDLLTHTKFNWSTT